MFKKIIISLFVLLFIGALASFYITNSEAKKVIKENKVLEEQSSLQIVTLGERIESNKIYFIQWESLHKKAQTEAIKKYKIFMFSPKEFQNKKNAELIKELIQNQKTVLFYGYRMNVKDILDSANNPIPYLEIKSSKQIYHYLYGYGYSDEAKRMLPITIMGNFTKDTMNVHLSEYLIKTYVKK
ncbi:hypothetical protein [Bacillus thuringiensis]|uniref:hypothetical protein n=1 Tax=Bacillus thuringiensis TaxID=1428 RepID=UPI0021D6875D|nr:hypothetical protein [Bacillus thuringiensis]MCU7666762.1 hypothetical protein [Bacillus thuringiensis]